MKHIAWRTTLSLFSLLYLAACQTPAPNMTLEKPDFSSKKPMTLEVGDIKIEEDYRDEKTPQHVEHRLPVTPKQAMKNWANQRLRTTSGNNQLVLEIEDASIVESDLPKNHIGWKDGFYVEPTKQYQGRMKATLKLYAAGGRLPKAVADVQVDAQESALENATLFERDQLLNQIMLTLIYRFDNEMERQINQYFKPYRVYK